MKSIDRSLWKKLLVLDEIDHQEYIGGDPAYIRKLKQISAAMTDRSIKLNPDGTLPDEEDSKEQSVKKEM